MLLSSFADQLLWRGVVVCLLMPKVTVRLSICSTVSRFLHFFLAFSLLVQKVMTTFSFVIIVHFFEIPAVTVPFSKRKTGSLRIG